MNTTLTPLSEAEKRMIAEFAGCYYATNKNATVVDAFHEAESLIREFRTRYGATGAETEPIREAEITLMDAIRMLHPDKTLTIYDSDCMGVITHDSGVGEWPFNSLPELIAILKGGKSE